jgi:hypothetical protein
MSAVAGRKEVHLPETEATMRKYLLSRREGSPIVLFDAIDVTPQDPVSPPSRPKERQAVDEFKIRVPIGNAVGG